MHTYPKRIPITRGRKNHLSVPYVLYVPLVLPNHPPTSDFKIHPQTIYTHPTKSNTPTTGEQEMTHHLQKIYRFLCCATLAAIIAGVQPAAAQEKFAIDGERIANADQEPGNWLSHGRTYGEQRFSPLDQITVDNIDDLGLAWAFPTESGRGHEASPIVVDGAMFLTLPWSIVLALDAKTGDLLWRYDPEVPREWGRNACCDVINRGVAVWKGKVYVGTIDGRLVALDAKDGSLVWEQLTIDKSRPYTITGAPRVVKDKVVIGNGGAEYGVRGYITAYDVETGQQEWRFYTVPGNPDLPFEHPELEMAAETWNGQWWEVGGGGTAWDSMAYDPELNLLYVGTGNGSPWNRELRSPGGGDNLFLSSILAINPDNGRLLWHYQTTPADNWDYTATQHIVLADMKIDGEERKVLMQAPKNGFFYVLDRETGELLSAKNFVPVTWASRVDMETGRPVETGGGDYSESFKIVYPSPTGAHNWHPMSYSPQTNLVYIPTIHEAFIYANPPEFTYTPGAWNTGIDFVKLAQLASTMPPPPVFGYLRAWDPVKQEKAWDVQHDTLGNGGILSTAGGLVFQGTAAGRFAAYNATNGEKLWEFTTNVGIVAPPISYAIDDQQYVAVLAGWGGVPPIIGSDAGKSAATTHANFGHMLAFKLGGETEMPEVAKKRFTIIPEPPVGDASDETIAKGQAVYHQHCAVCHGMLGISAGVISDLRYSSSAVHQNFNRIVLDGAMIQTGMAPFNDLLTKEDVEAIHAYVKHRARQDRATQLENNAQ